MAIINNFKKSIQNDELRIDTRLISHQAFQELIAFLKSEVIVFKEVTVDTEKTANVIIKGNSSLFSLVFQNSYFYIYKDDGTPANFEFEWHGIISEVSTISLYELDIIRKHPLSSFSSLLESKFSNVEFLFSSETTSFIIQSSESDVTFAISEIGFYLENISFFYERSLNQSIPSEHNISAEVMLGETIIAVDIELPANNTEDISCWSLNLSYGIHLENGIKDFAAFLSKNTLVKGVLGDNLESYLPEAVQKFSNCVIEEFNVLFDPTKPAIYLMESYIVFNTDWEILPNFVLQNIGLKTSLSFHGPKVLCNLEISGSFSFIDDWFVNVNLRLPLNTKDNWTIYLDGYANLEKIQDLEKLPFIDISKLNLPKEWLILNSIQLEKLEIIFNPIKAKIISVDFAISMDSESVLIPGITVKDPELAFTLTFDE